MQQRHRWEMCRGLHWYQYAHTPSMLLHNRCLQGRSAHSAKLVGSQESWCVHRRPCAYNHLCAQSALECKTCANAALSVIVVIVTTVGLYAIGVVLGLKKTVAEDHGVAMLKSIGLKRRNAAEEPIIDTGKVLKALQSVNSLDLVDMSLLLLTTHTTAVSALSLQPAPSALHCLRTN